MESDSVKRFKSILGESFKQELMIEGSPGNPDRVKISKNWTSNPDFKGYWPVFLGRPDGGEDRQPERILAIVDNAHKREHAKGQTGVAIPMDTGHRAYQDVQTIYGQVDPLNVKALDAKEVLIEGLEPLPEGSLWLMVQPEIYLEHYNDVKKGLYGFRPSVALSGNVLLNLTFCQVPKVQETPNIELDSETVVEKFEGIVEIEFGKESYMIQDPALLEKVKGIFATIGIAEEKVMAICEVLDDADATLITGAIQTTEAQESQNPPSKIDELESKLSEVTGILNELKAKNEATELTNTELNKKIEGIELMMKSDPKPGYQIKTPKKEEDLSEAIGNYMRTNGVNYNTAVAEILKKRGK